MIIVALALVGGIAGATLLRGHLGGFALGAACGALAGWVLRLNDRLDRLERRVAEATGAAAHDSRAERSAAAAVSVERSAEPTPPRERRAADAASAAPAAAMPAPARPSPAPRPPGLAEVALGRLRVWFTTGNVPVKVGVVLSLFGVGFLIKAAVDRHWLTLPVELRLILVALFGFALLLLGWRLRMRQRSFALSVQGGGIAILYLTTYASFAVFDFLPGAAAFALLLAVTAAVGALAVLQDAPALAVLGIIGGFMAPLLASTAEDNHVVLFGYYGVLNLAIVGVAWFRSWRALNVLGFLFTFAIGSLWGYAGYRPEHFATTEPFLVLFVLMYTLIPLLFATRQPPDLKGFVDGTLVFGTPLVGFGLQSRLVEGMHHGLATSALVLAAYYFALAMGLAARRAAHLRVLMEAFLALAGVFLALYMPLALDARWTSAGWALQGAAAVWLGLRQRRPLVLAVGAALQVAAGGVHFVGDYLGGGPAARPMLNGAYLGAVLLAAGGWLSGWLVDRAPAVEPASGMRRFLAPKILAPCFLAWGTAWWLLAGLAELWRHAPGRLEPAVALLLVTATALVAVLAAPRVRWTRLNALGLLTLPAMAFAAFVALMAKPHPLADLGWIAWPCAFSVHALFLRLRETQFPRLRTALHCGAFWLLAWLLAPEAAWLVGRLVHGIWPVAAALAAVAALVQLTLRASARRGWPVGVNRSAYVYGAAGIVLAVLAYATFRINLTSPGDPAPLLYVPLLNPLELASGFVVFVMTEWWRAARRPGIDARLGVAIPTLFALFLLTMTVARTVHHWLGVPFAFAPLAASTQLQAALSIVWGTAGIAAMLIGARGTRRELWLAGAGLMAIVVVKLFLVDLGHAGTGGRVVSFLGVGLLLLVVGYFAPVPPRSAPP